MLIVLLKKKQKSPNAKSASHKYLTESESFVIFTVPTTELPGHSTYIWLFKRSIIRMAEMPGRISVYIYMCNSN